MGQEDSIGLKKINDRRLRPVVSALICILRGGTNGVSLGWLENKLL